jgi:ribosomal protein S18 acetylase RimI-like enzyme
LYSVEQSPEELEDKLLIKIRAADLSDFGAITDVWNSSGMLSNLNDPREDLEFALAGPTSTVLVAVDEAERIAGTIMAGHDGHRGNLYYLAVHPDFRMRGIGRQLVTAAERRLRGVGIRKIHLLVLRENFAVKPFYNRLGYAEAPAVLFRKWLVEPSKA